MIFLKNIFRRASIFTIANVYLVILAGGIVRCTGSGMGCPDWPKCFGKWIPPTEVKELPVNYIDLYSNGGHLTVEFNVYKTWTEYFNRLLGVLVGIAIFTTLIASLGYWKLNKQIVYLSFASFLLVGLQGWIGAKVVASNLKPVIISIHMFFALLIVALLIRAQVISKNIVNHKAEPETYKSIESFSFILCFLVLIQVLIGTQVRQWVDQYLVSVGNRIGIMDNSGIVFNIHVVMAYIVIAFTFFLAYKLYKKSFQPFVMWSLLGCILTEYVSGLFLYKFDLPGYMQPIHLTCASMLFGLCFYLYSLFPNFENQYSKRIVTE